MATVVVNTKEAHKEITEAQDHQKSTAKWLVWLILIVLAIVAVVVLVILLKKK
jgi:t-SNARE complex subunit (syntaxin)